MGTMLVLVTRSAKRAPHKASRIVKHRHKLGAIELGHCGLHMMDRIELVRAARRAAIFTSASVSLCIGSVGSRTAFHAR